MTQDPGIDVLQVMNAISPRQRHRDPAAGPGQELSMVTEGLRQLLRGGFTAAGSRLAPHGFTLGRDQDPVTGRQYYLAVSELRTERTWGLYLVDRSAAPSVCIAVPHLRTDATCEQLALWLWRAVPGAFLCAATVHRDVVMANGKAADQARNAASVFQHAWSDVAAAAGMPQIQIHGFADVDPDRPTLVRGDVVVSVGGARLTLPALRLAEGIDGLNLTPRLDCRRGWDGTAEPRLRATGNTQGRAAVGASYNRVWIHLEHNARIRNDPTRWQSILAEVVAARPREYRPVQLSAGAGSVVTVDADAGYDHVRMVLPGNRTLGVPSGGTWGQRILVQVGADRLPRTLKIDPVLHGASILPASVLVKPGEHCYLDLWRGVEGDWRMRDAFHLDRAGQPL